MTQERPLIELINEHLKGELHDLPVFSSVAVKLQQMLASRNFKMEDVIEMISEDQALASQVLKIANSSYYAGLSKIGTIKDAVVRLGAQEIANLVMMASQLEMFKSENEILNSSMKGLWQHSLACATGAKWLAKKAGYTAIAAECFMGGLLHDIGQLALLKALDDIVRMNQSKALLSATLISEILDKMHKEVGYNLLKTWCLPDSYCSIALNHHNGVADPNDILLLIVCLSDITCKKIGVSLHTDPTISIVASQEANLLGIKELTLAELEIIIEDTVGASF